MTITINNKIRLVYLCILNTLQRIKIFCKYKNNFVILYKQVDYLKSILFINVMRSQFGYPLRFLLIILKRNNYENQ